MTSDGAMKKKSGDTRIGISGWTYKPWRGVFYPEGLPQKQELTYAAEGAGRAAGCGADFVNCEDLQTRLNGRFSLFRRHAFISISV